ncbi:sodium/glutamate symporter [Pontibacter chitinilyticus]|uniref:sodium/glutamate symporter n=1 Tax=Pontibacter chitinilyticus TaxID=2674989 RepID=UPI0032193195
MPAPVHLHLPFLFAVALAGVASLVGQWLVRSIAILRRAYVPEPLLGGLLVALVFLLLRKSQIAIVDLPTQGAEVDFLVGLLTANMGLHITPRILRHGYKLFFIFLGAGLGLAILQFIVVLPVATMGAHPVYTAILAGPLSFVGAPFNLNPPSQTGPIAHLFQLTYPHLKETAQGVMMVGVLCSIFGANLVSRRMFQVAEKQPPKPAPSETQARLSLSTFATEFTCLIVLIFVLVSVAFGIQWLLLNKVSWLQDDYVPVIVLAFLLGAACRLLFSVAVDKSKFPEKALTVLLLGPTMNLVLSYAIMSVPLHYLWLLTPQLLAGALLAIGCSVAVSWLAYGVFTRFTNRYYAAVIATAFLVVTTGWGPMAMSFLRRFMNEEGPVEPMPVIMPLNAFFLFPWMVILLTTVLLHLFG